MKKDTHLLYENDFFIVFVMKSQYGDSVVSINKGLYRTFDENTHSTNKIGIAFHRNLELPVSRGSYFAEVANDFIK